MWEKCVGEPENAWKNVREIGNTFVILYILYIGLTGGIWGNPFRDESVAGEMIYIYYYLPTHLST